LENVVTRVSRIAVVNRGEPAVRFLRGLSDYNRERDTALTAVALYTDPDRGAPFLRLADDTVSLGRALNPGPAGGMVSAYTDHDRVLAAIQATGCDAVWPGWGFVAEDASFVARLEQEGITFIGPSSTAMQQLGDKIAAKRVARDVGVPLAPWHVVGRDEPLAATLEAAAHIGYPLVVKASAGAGGRGIRIVDNPEALASAILAVHDEATRSFRAGGILLEACVTSARHIEVQIVVGVDNIATALGIRDCSIQRRHQKVIEESPSPVVGCALQRRLEQAAERLCAAVAYRGVCTVEYLVDPARDFAHFLEVNTRLQVEHTITEMTTGIDLVHVQLDIARGLAWEPCDSAAGAGRKSASPRGHAIEVRLNAEDPERDFQPSPGLVRVFRPPLGPGIRVDSGVAEGVVIAHEFDSMIAKLIAHGRDRKQALARLGRALRELEISVEDGATNKAFLSELITDPAFLDGSADTGWLDRRMSSRRPIGTLPGYFEALCVAAILVRRRALDEAIASFFSDVKSGIPYRLDIDQMPIALSLRGAIASFEAHLIGVESGASHWMVGPRAEHGDARLQRARLELLPGGHGSAVLSLFDGVRSRRHVVLTSVGMSGITVEVDGHIHLVELATGGHIRSPAPALVVALHVAVGDAFAAGARMCTLEAMKMEVPVLAPRAGIVRTIMTRPNEQVQSGQVLFEVDSDVAHASQPQSTHGRPSAVVSPLSWLSPAGVPDPQAISALAEVEQVLAVTELCQVVRLAFHGLDAPDALLAEAEALLACEDGFRKLRRPEAFRPLVELLVSFCDVEQLFAQELAVDHQTRPLEGKLAFFDVCRALDPVLNGSSIGHGHGGRAIVSALEPRLLRALSHFGVPTLKRGPALAQALWRLAYAHTHTPQRYRLANLLLRALMALDEAGLDLANERELELFLTRMATIERPELPALRDNARQARYLFFRRKRMPGRAHTVPALRLSDIPGVDPAQKGQAIGALLTVTYGEKAVIAPLGASLGIESFGVLGRDDVRSLAVLFAAPFAARVIDAVATTIASMAVGGPFEIHLFALGLLDGEPSVSQLLQPLEALAATSIETATVPTRVAVTWTPDGEHKHHRSFAWRDGHLRREAEFDDVHPERARRLELWRYADFRLVRLAEIPSSQPILAWRARARVNPKDERIIVVAEIRRLPTLSDEPPSGEFASGASEDADTALRELEWVFAECLRVIREAQAQRGSTQRYFLNRIVIHVSEVTDASTPALMALARHLIEATRGHGLQKIVVRTPIVRDGRVEDRVLQFALRGRQRLEVHEEIPSREALGAASDYHLRAERARRLGTVYPYETVRALQGTAGAELVLASHPDMAFGRFQELDLDSSGLTLVPVDRAPGLNTAGVVVGMMTHVTRKHPDGMTRVWIASDATTAMGALAEPECRRIVAALTLAREMRVPIEWLPISSGARISMDSGTENLDWAARVLAAIIRFTQAGGEINIIVAGVNVGAQSYWNAEATMLMHTRGVLIQTGDGSMVLTGKKALEVSGSVAAEDERGIGGYERIMGPNGQAQFWARHLSDAYRILFEYCAFTYVAPGELGPRRFPTRDPNTRSILGYRPEQGLGDGLVLIGDLFSDETNPGRKKPFAIRAVMQATIDQDGGRLERYGDLAGGETAVVWDAHLGGHAVCLIGFESKNQPRRDQPPLDGPDHWTGGTLFPQSSKKVARAINQASGNRPVVVLANLSGFDGSPESMRKLQLEYGAEIGRAVVNFKGPIVFVVIGRYHGGAYVVFSKALNPDLTAFAVEGAYASVIGGAPAAAVVFPREVRARANKDERIILLRNALEAIDAVTDGDRRATAVAELERELCDAIVDYQARLAREFDAVHSVARAVSVGSLDAVIEPGRVRERIIEVLDRRQSSTSQPFFGGARVRADDTK